MGLSLEDFRSFRMNFLRTVGEDTQKQPIEVAGARCRPDGYIYGGLHIISDEWFEDSGRGHSESRLYRRHVVATVRDASVWLREVRYIPAVLVLRAEDS